MQQSQKFYSKDKEKTTDVWLTPPDLIDKLGVFDLDPCCPNNLKWSTAKNYYSLDNGQDGLELEWFGRVWLNPPYSNWVDFIKKLKDHGNGIAFIFARTETRGFFNHIWYDADSIFFIKKRVRLLKSDGITFGMSPAPSVLVCYGKNNTDSIINSGIDGKLILLDR